jgi:hypothetical protein
VASVPGSVLQDDLTQLVLETRSSMFPIHEIDFAATRLSPGASWHLESGTDLLAPFYGVFRVLINTRDAELKVAVGRGAKDKRQQALLDELESGLTALLIEMALYLQDELMQRDEWPAETVGDMLSRMLEMARPNPGFPPSAHDLTNFRTHLAGAVRNAGKGRIFQ